MKNEPEDKNPDKDIPIYLVSETKKGKEFYVTRTTNGIFIACCILSRNFSKDIPLWLITEDAGRLKRNVHIKLFQPLDRETWDEETLPIQRNNIRVSILKYLEERIYDYPTDKDALLSRLKSK